MSAIFDFTSLLTVLVLLICTCTYLRELRPTIFDSSNAPSNEGDTTTMVSQMLRALLFH